jgi:hypothetical protein
VRRAERGKLCAATVMVPIPLRSLTQLLNPIPHPTLPPALIPTPTLIPALAL